MLNLIRFDDILTQMREIYQKGQKSIQEMEKWIFKIEFICITSSSVMSNLLSCIIGIMQ